MFEVFIRIMYPAVEACGRPLGECWPLVPSNDLEQGLLHALAGHIAG
jgi:hypothetical protein